MGNPSNTGQTDRPDRIRDPGLPRGQRTLDRFFDTSAFVRQAAFTFGNAPRNALEAPGLVNFDVAVYK